MELTLRLPVCHILDVEQILFVLQAFQELSVFLSLQLLQVVVVVFLVEIWVFCSLLVNDQLLFYWDRDFGSFCRGGTWVIRLVYSCFSFSL